MILSHRTLSATRKCVLGWSIPYKTVLFLEPNTKLPISALQYSVRELWTLFEHYRQHFSKLLRFYHIKFYHLMHLHGASYHMQ